MNRLCSFLGIALALASGCATRPDQSPASVAGASTDRSLSAEVDEFLAAYSARYQALARESQLAEWASNTRIVPGDTTNAERTRAANEKRAHFVGSAENIAQAKRFLERRSELSPLSVKQLERVLFNAAASPMTIPEVVKARIAAEAAQSELLYGFRYEIDGKTVTTNDIDEALRTERDLAKRRTVWEASKKVGPPLRNGLIELRRLRNEIVRPLGYRDFFSYRASEYGTSTEQLAEIVDRINRELRPLYIELHTYVRHLLAERYGQPVPDLIPADWLPNRWGQDWGALVEVAGYDLDSALRPKEPRWLVEQAERFYVSLGFEALPAAFWQDSSLYPLAPDAGYQKNNHASAWHVDLDRGVRCLMSVIPNADWYETTHHELGHIYYYLCYSTPEVPLLLREGADRAYHEAVGSLMGLAAMQPRFVRAIGIDAGAAKVDPMQVLLKEALNYVVFIPWSSGTMFHFERELYAEELPPERWNRRWWELAARYQGIVPPAPRGEEWCDPATKTHINDDPGEYYDYALSFVLLFQLHDHISRKILKEDPRDSNYYARRDVGDFLRSILRRGATAGGQELLQETIGAPLSARAMADYFAPLAEWLREQNRGRTHTLKEI